jgi:choline-sulfatase
MPARRRPSILLCLCDQLRALSVGCYGDRCARTPSIDRFAASAARCDLAITPNPVCTPARSALLSGQYSRTCAGMLGNTHDDPPNPKRVRLREPTLPERLREAGYRTALVGKWHIDPQPTLLGFDTAVYPRIPHRYYGQTYFDQPGRRVVVEGFGPDWELQRSRDFLADRARDGEPFFLYHNISLPHQPIGPGHMPERYVRLFDRQQVPVRANALLDGTPAHSRWWFSVYRSADFFWRHRRGEPQDPADIAPEDFDLRDLTALYYGAAACTDDLFGRLLEAVEANGLADDTVVVFASDHGDNLGSHGLFNKNALIEESIRVPLIFRVPGRSASVISPPVSLIDVAPTLLDLAGIGGWGHMQGQSLAPALGGDVGGLRDAAFIETGREIGIRTERHLLGVPHDEARRRAGPEVSLLFDLAADPYELRNLAGVDEADGAATAAPRERLRERLLTWDRQTPWLDVLEDG